MDRVYYQLLHDAYDIGTLASWIVQNADYKEEIKAATDHMIIDCIKEVQRMKITLQDVIMRQKCAEGLSEQTARSNEVHNNY